MTSYELATYKRIILCCDGTWMDSDRGSNERPANVARIARAIASSSLDRDKKVVKQIVYYHPGLGSGDMPLQRAIRGEPIPTGGLQAVSFNYAAVLTRDPFPCRRNRMRS